MRTEEPEEGVEVDVVVLSVLVLGGTYSMGIETEA